MRICAYLVAVSAAILATADVVAGGWLKIAPEAKYGDFCSSIAQRSTAPHVCFSADPSFFKQVQANSDFQGYLAPDMTGFVLIPGSASSSIITSQYTMSVTFDMGSGGSSCAQIYFRRPGKDGMMFQHYLVCQPGGQVISMPAQLPSLAPAWKHA